LSIEIIKQVVSGYSYLVEQKIIHRDLKPSNILKKGDTWKICDFGFALKGNKNYIGELNVGTAFYMAPESL
jgi:serine/threonine protein kinase